MKTVAAISALAALASAGASPGNVRIKSVGYAGTGCPQGSAYASIADNGGTVTVLFDSYVATVGAGSRPQDQRKACTLNLEVLYPSGFQFSIFTVRTQGYINTDPGVSGQVRNSYFFSGQRGVASSTTNIPGGTKGNWKKEDAVNNYSSVYSPCGGDGIVNIQTSVALQGNGNGYISADSIDAGFDQKFRQDYGLDWVPCNGGKPQAVDPNYKAPPPDAAYADPVPPPSTPAPAPYDDGDDAPYPAPAPYTPPVPAPAPYVPPQAAPAPSWSSGPATGISSPLTEASGNGPFPFNPFLNGGSNGGNPWANNPFNPFASNPYNSNPFNSNPWQSSSPFTTVISQS